MSFLAWALNLVAFAICLFYVINVPYSKFRSTWIILTVMNGVMMIIWIIIFSMGEMS